MTRDLTNWLAEPVNQVLTIGVMLLVLILAVSGGRRVRLFFGFLFIIFITLALIIVPTVWVRVWTGDGW